MSHEKEKAYASKILDLVLTNISPLSAIERTNDNKRIQKENIIKILEDKIRHKKLQPQITLLVLGVNDMAHPNFIRSFMELIAYKMGDDPQKILSFFAIDILFSNANPALLKSVGLCPAIQRYVTHKIGALKKLYSISMSYVFMFVYTISAFKFEISLKYNNAALEQKDKIEKLYNKKDRIAMLISAATNSSGKLLQNHALESKDIIPVMKKTLQRSQTLITADDLFNKNYKF